MLTCVHLSDNILFEGIYIMKDKEFFKEILDTFENNDLKEFCDQCLDTIPDYFWHVGASSSGKYHPQYSLGDHGLARHTIALCRILNHMLSVDCVKNQFTSRERDLLRIAGLMHDSRKSGSQEDYEKSKYTKFDHPMLAADAIAHVWNNYTGKEMTIEEAKLIMDSIRSHMGQWNTDKRNPGIVLPTPQTKYQIILHLADYLASRKDIEVLFDNLQEASEPQPDVNTWRIPFGKYKGMTLIEIKDENPGYIEWAKDNINSEPCHSLVMKL